MDKPIFVKSSIFLVRLWWMMCFVLLILTQSVAQSQVHPSFSKKEIEHQLDAIPICVEYDLNKTIIKYIRDYTLLARDKTERTLGSTLQYFPIFDHYLDLYGLPQDLKALAVIESALRPTVVSPRGASGLWQLMPNTARQYDVQINDYVDERNNPVKATEAAVQHLAKLYDRFGSWELAIAAYNCGSTRMRRAIQDAQSRHFDKVKKHLPRETQQYVFKYIAANYMLNYYLLYDLHPKYPDYNHYVTRVVRVCGYDTFQNIQTETGVALSILERLNPGFKNRTVPPTSNGSYIILPKIGSKKTPNKLLAGQKDKSPYSISIIN